ncbi:E3 ubiquitin-protein ligase RNFT1 [Euphorbia peplus]|nr:E3 ubiquitin-protein ligase RNFT1 [Euphorbia peplus]
MESCSPTSSSSPPSPPSSNSTAARRYGINLAASNLIHSPLTTLLEYSGILGGGGGDGGGEREQLIPSLPSSSRSNSGDRHEEVTIRIIGAAESNSAAATSSESNSTPSSPVSGDQSSSSGVPETLDVDGASGITTDASTLPTPNSASSSYQRYDIQNFARWIEQILPFSLLLLLVFIRQHIQGFCLALWVGAVLFKSNDILRKQTSLKGQRKNSILVAMTMVFILHVVSIYWWYRNDDLLHPFILVPPAAIPHFWQAIFIIVVNDSMIRQAAMASKCILLMYYKNSRGCNYRKQGQILTIIEYFMLLYRALLPAPVWYRFFLNKEYGNFFSSLITGLYLTFKLTSVLGKVQLFFTALRALSHKEMHYGSYATSEQVNAIGDMCAICQEKMHTPILLRCKHIFCEDCVSEWFERERTCPLCRALVKPADIRTYSDGSTSLSFQLF